MSDAVQEVPLTGSLVAPRPLRIGERQVGATLVLALCAILVLIIGLPLWALLS